MAVYPVLLIEVIEGQAGHGEARPRRRKPGGIALVRACPRPCDHDGVAFLQYRHQGEALIRASTARDAHTLFKAIAAQGLTIPRIAWIVAYCIGFADVIVARIDPALRPDLFDKRR